MKQLLKWIRKRWHNDLYHELQEIKKELQDNKKDILANQAMMLFQRHNLDYLLKNEICSVQHSSYSEFLSDKNVEEHLMKRYSLLKEHNPPYIRAYCVVCDKYTVMSPHYSEGSPSETYFCCGMNGRMRAMYEYIVTHFQNNKRVYIQEAITPAYNAYEKFFGPDNISGSEYIGFDKICGEYYKYNGNRIMHQDCTKLSFNDNTFDLLISQHVFEHIFDVKKALSESIRVLKDDGYSIISIPFFYDSQNSVMLIEQGENGRINQIIDPPEIHGNPITGIESPTFWHHGWDFVEAMRDVGYRDVQVHFFSNLYKGYLGLIPIITGKKSTTSP